MTGRTQVQSPVLGLFVCFLNITRRITLTNIKERRGGKRLGKNNNYIIFNAGLEIIRDLSWDIDSEVTTRCFYF